MIKINKALTSKTISLIIAVSFLMADISYAGASSQGSLRAPAGQMGFYDRMKKAKISGLKPAMEIAVVLDILYGSTWTDNLDFIPAYYDKGVFREVKQLPFEQWLEDFYEGNGPKRVNFEKHNALMAAYREPVKAIKVRIKSKENPTFFSAESNELMVTGTLQSSLFSGDNIITSFLQKLCSAAEKTVVSQKFHLSNLLDRDLFVLKNRGSIMQAGLDVICGNVRIALFYDIWRSHSLFKQFNNHIHRNTCAFNAGFAKTNCRVNRNSFHQIICHFAYLQKQLYHNPIEASSSIPSVYIQPAGLEQAYDIEAEVIYNFTGNGIFAHNTAIWPHVHKESLILC